MRLLLLIIFPVTLLFIFGGCGKESSELPLDAPKSWLGHHVMEPGKKSYRYQFENLSTGQLTSKMPEGAKYPERLKDSIWQSTTKGELNFQFQSYQSHKKRPEPLATFQYTLRDLSFAESTSSDGGLSWSEEYNDEDVVKMTQQDLSRDDAMGEMLGDPRDHFLRRHSLAQFLPNGIAAKINGKVLQRANYIDRKFDTASIGQYFLKGIPVEEIAHRIGIMTLPKKGVVDGLSWQVPLECFVVSLEKGAAKDQMTWTYVSKLNHEGKEAYVLTFKAQQKILRGRSVVSGAEVRGWFYDCQGKAIVEKDTSMPIELEIRESSGWVDSHDFQIIGIPKEKHHTIHHYKNTCTLKRS
ncbi:MAG: hypothetical protein HQL32_03545 [Planctomycetes bacterium]|nr:hypothetical protein [Planctomycetota bacterium]